MHWCDKIPDARREADCWRGRCPVKGCPTVDDRVFKFSVHGKSIWWYSFCPHHDKEFLRPLLRSLLGDCLPGRAAGPPPIRHDDLIELMLSDLPPISLKLAALELAGLGTREALDKLGVRPDNRGRVIAGRTGGSSKRTRNRR